MALILLSHKGMAQGNPLSMVIYDIALLPLAEMLREASKDVMQPWYADDAAMQGAVEEVAGTMVGLVKVGKTGNRVVDVLQRKHPNMMIPDLEEEGWAPFKEYPECPASMTVNCTVENVEEIAGKLRGGSGPSSVDALMLSKWLL